MDLIPLVSSFSIVALAEIGDKTQLAVIGLSSKHKTKSVFMGALLAFAVVDGVSALIGETIALFVSPFWIGLGGGIAFLFFGIYTILAKGDEHVNVGDHKMAMFSSFSLIALMEMGDKTQLGVIALAAEYESSVLVFVGVMLAFIAVTALGVTLGTVISRKIPLRYVRVGAGILFLLFGVLFLWSAWSGIKIF